MSTEWALILLGGMWAFFGAIITSAVYARKNRSTVRGAILGAVGGAFTLMVWPVLVWALVPPLGEKCSNCDQIIPPDALKCPRCGHELIPVAVQQGQGAIGQLEVATHVPQPYIQQGPSFIREIVETGLLIAAIYAFVNLATARFVVDGHSMLPNFTDDQFIIVSRLSYILGEPQRGDVVVFHYPQQQDRDFIKRIIGLPGETVTIREGRVYINGHLIEEPYIENFCRGKSCDGEWKVGEDEYFVLGDNRGASKDSQDFGPVGRKYLVGKAFIRYWPPSAWQLIPHHSYSSNGAPLPTLTPTPLYSPTPPAPYVPSMPMYTPVRPAATPVPAVTVTPTAPVATPSP